MLKFFRWGFRLGRLRVSLTRTNATSHVEYSVASWSYYATGYWRWALYWSPPQSVREAFCLPRVGPCKNQGKDWFGYWGFTSFSGWARLPLIGCVHLSTQPPFDAMKRRRHVGA